MQRNKVAQETYTADKINIDGSNIDDVKNSHTSEHWFMERGSNEADDKETDQSQSMSTVSVGYVAIQGLLNFGRRSFGNFNPEIEVRRGWPLYLCTTTYIYDMMP